MNKPLSHPDTESWDRLRAGLLDDSPELRDSLQQHLAHCSHCQQAWQRWDTLAASAMPALNVSTSAIHGRRPQGNTRRWLPAVAAAITLSLGLGLWWQSTPELSTPEVLAREDAVPDLYEDLDFYLWLATEGAQPKQESPNNT